MSNVWLTRHRLLFERLERLAGRLKRKEPIAGGVLEDETMRLVAGVLMVLKTHRLNKRGQCQYCGWTRWSWRLWRKRPACTVYRNLDFAMSQPLEVVWRQVEEDRGA